MQRLNRRFKKPIDWQHEVFGVFVCYRCCYWIIRSEYFRLIQKKWINLKLNYFKFFQQSFTPEQRKAFEEKLVSDCAKKEGATADDLTAIAKREMPTTPTGKCMHACFIETLGFVSIICIKIHRTFL